MVIVNKHYHDGFDEVHTHNKLKYYRIKKEENTKAFWIYSILLLKGLYTCATRNNFIYNYVFKMYFYPLRAQYLTCTIMLRNKWRWKKLTVLKY